MIVISIVALFTLIYLPNLLTLGMFFDGLTYSSIARNLAENVGSFWSPHYTLTAHPEYYFHPPLGFFIQSLFFKIFNDNFYLERIISVSFGFITLFLLYIFWHKYVLIYEKRIISPWYFLALWILNPISIYVINNNLMDNYQLTFMLIALILLLENKLIKDLLSGLCLFLAFLTKGPPALLVLVFLLLKIIIVKDKKSLKSIFVVSLVSLSIFLLIYISFSDSREFFTNYFDVRILKSFTEYKVVNTHFFLLKELFRQLIIPFVVSLVLWLLVGRPQLIFNRSALLFFVLGISGTIPFLFSYQQYERYLYPFLPFTFIGVALVFSNVSELIYKNILLKYKFLLFITSTISIIIALFYLIINIGKITDQSNFHSDFTLQPLNLKNRITASVCPSDLAINWDLVASFQRYLKISLSPDQNHEYKLIATDSGCKLEKNCRKIHPPKPQNFILYACEKNT